jgi:hypothetical protein
MIHNISALKVEAVCSCEALVSIIRIYDTEVQHLHDKVASCGVQLLVVIYLRRGVSRRSALAGRGEVCDARCSSPVANHSIFGVRTAHDVRVVAQM